MKDTLAGIASIVAVAILMLYGFACMAYGLYQPCLNETWIFWHPAHVLGWVDVCSGA